MKTFRPSVASWKEAFKKHGSRCAYCDDARKVDFSGALEDYVNSSIDHLVPTSRSGGNRAANIVPACVSCNFYKKELVPEEEFERLTEMKSDGRYVREESLSRYLELTCVIVKAAKEKKRKEFEAFRRYVQAG